MKRISIILTCILLMFTCSACYIRALDTARNYRYHPPPSSKTTYEQLLSYTKTLDGWSFGNLWRIEMGEKSLDEFSADSEETYIKVLDELEKILKDITLYGLEQPENIRNYNKYAEDLVERPRSDNKIFANFSAGLPGGIADEEEYLYNLRIVLPDITRCYIIVDYITNVEYISRRYVYYTEDSEVIEDLVEWAEGYAIYEFDQG